MVRTFEDRIDYVDALEDIKHQVSFMSDACMALLSREDCGLMSEQSIGGLHEIFSRISEQLDAVENAFQEKFFDVVAMEKEGQPQNHEDDFPASLSDVAYLADVRLEKLREVYDCLKDSKDGIDMLKIEARINELTSFIRSVLEPVNQLKEDFFAVLTRSAKKQKDARATELASVGGTTSET